MPFGKSNLRKFRLSNKKGGYQSRIQSKTTVELETIDADEEAAPQKCVGIPGFDSLDKSTLSAVFKDNLTFSSACSGTITDGEKSKLCEHCTKLKNAMRMQLKRAKDVSHPNTRLTYMTNSQVQANLSQTKTKRKIKEVTASENFGEHVRTQLGIVTTKQRISNPSAAPKSNEADNETISQQRLDTRVDDGSVSNKSDYGLDYYGDELKSRTEREVQTYYISSDGIITQEPIETDAVTISRPPFRSDVDASLVQKIANIVPDYYCDVESILVKKNVKIEPWDMGLPNDVEIEIARSQPTPFTYGTSADMTALKVETLI